jgi:hypothetical protein
MIIEESILIHAKIDKVWDTFTDLTCWKQWNTVMEDVRIRAQGLSCGEEFSCCFRPFLLPIQAKIRVEEAKPYERIVWSAQKKGFSARNIFTFQNNEKGVIVTSRDTFNGLIIRIFGFLLPQKRLRTLIQTFLKDLKTASENQRNK